MNSSFRISLVIFSLLFALSVAADNSAEAKKRTQADAKVCVNRASEIAYKFMGLNSNWRQPYNECLREKLNQIARIHIKNSLQVTKLELECEQAGIKPSDIAQALSVDIIHIMAKASDSTMQKQRTSIEIEQNIEEFYQKILTSRHTIKKLKHHLKK